MGSTHRARDVLIRRVDGELPEYGEAHASSGDR